MFFRSAIFPVYILMLSISFIGCESFQSLYKVEQDTYTCPDDGKPCYKTGREMMTQNEYQEQSQRVSQRQQAYNAQEKYKKNQVRQFEDRKKRAQEDLELSQRKSFFKKGFCYWTGPFKYVVNQKLDENHYGAVTEIYDKIEKVSQHAIFELDSFNSDATYLNVDFEYIKTIDVKLGNGFTTKVDVLKECVLCDDKGPNPYNPKFCPKGHKSKRKK